jgi:hypothetical protein
MIVDVGEYRDLQVGVDVEQFARRPGECRDGRVSHSP